MTVCIEGNIGAGKSELLRRLAADGLSTRPEPVDRWRPLLNQVYNCGRGLVALQARIILDAGVTPAESIVERDPAFQIPVFIKKALHDGSITRHEAGVLTDLHARVVTWTSSRLIYLRCAPDECLARVRRRARVEEDGLDLAALSELHVLYESAFAHAREEKHVVDVTLMDAAEVHARVRQLLRPAMPRDDGRPAIWSFPQLLL